ncbi:pilus assembly protein [Zhongshania aliphaticivorans]|uniref:pilus assembly protein n=1 Tax=Zhongshania aliphaticivorans TaxID=1470434 RepID=UPI0012E3FC6E|nr:PilC/PilY family type IV pilus protein [Zhongshania aliphaticivorans]CAA0114925.1 Type IV pilus biogenesis factor PilY1 [Zhongshania aliphaticivorans]
MTAFIRFIFGGMAVRNMLLVLLATSAISVPSFAEECTITVTSPNPVGLEFSATGVYMFPELESIVSVEHVEPDGDYVSNYYRCGFLNLFLCSNTKEYMCSSTPNGNGNGNGNDGYYNFTDNIISVINSNNNNKDQCRATFTVKGLKANCSPSPVEEIISDGNVAQAPLFLSQSAEPNVMYMLDDSGSMGWDYMPDGLSNDIRRKSPQFNSIYYNPGVTYRPWIKADGTSYPNASTTCPYKDPTKTSSSDDCQPLDIDSGCNSGGCGSSYFARYYWYSGSPLNPSQENSYVKKDLRTGQTYTGHGRENRQDCTNASIEQCSAAEEIQNFANWYTYYRTRILAARAGSGFAFAQQGSNMRIGFGSLNNNATSVDGITVASIISGVRPFVGEARENFYDNLYSLNPSGNTPLRRALDRAGKYFSSDDDKGPWSDTPGEDLDENVAEEHLACRRNYTVLMTDGYWNDDAASGGAESNNDGTSGEAHYTPSNSSYAYTPTSPFNDDRSNTLADVAMYYWKNDLRDDLDNVVNSSAFNPAFWQHMTTYGVGFGVTGEQDPETVFAAILNGSSIPAWGNPSSAGKYKIDDLLHAAVNSRGGYFSASEPEVFANELALVLQEISQQSKSSASSIAVNSTRLDSGTLVYQASFNSNDWSGRIQAYTLTESGAIDGVFWDTNSAGKIPAYGARNIVAGVGEQGVLITDAAAFSWDQLTDSQRDYLRLSSGESDAVAQSRLAWLAGDRSNENNSLRSRTQLLGDIVNSDPFYVGNIENYSYHLLPSPEGSTYASFLSTKAIRDPMLYVGANDGMLHGFNALTGMEKFAYIPVSVFPKLAQLSDPNYVHSYTVDGSPRANDAYLNNTWKTILVGATGAGGRSVFAIDVTSPTNLNSDKVMWEFSTPTGVINTIGVADPLDLRLHRLGVAMSAPVIARLKAGNKWVAVFGNGYDSADTVKLFVVDLASGALLRVIDTLRPGINNGLATVVPVDADGDRITDYVYGGDLEGNLWKFDFTGSTVASWGFSANFLTTVAGSLVPVPMFKAVDGNDVAQPITSRPTVGRHYSNGLMVYFGTGKYFETSDAQIGNNPQVQDFYGIHDTNSPVSRDDLAVQTVIAEGVMTTLNNTSTARRVRVTTDLPLQSAGWRLNLLSPAGANGERVVSPAVLRNGRIIFATIIPDESVCGYGGRSWLMELDAMTGGRIGDEAPELDDEGNVINGGVDSPALDINGDGKVDYLDVIKDGNDSYPPSGVGSDEMIKTPGIIGAGELEYKYTSGTSGSIGVITESAGDESQAGRQSWRQLQ